MKPEKPENNSTWLHSIYRGDIYKLPANRSSVALTNAVVRLLENTFQVDILQVHRLLSEEQFFQAMKLIRKQLFTEETFITHLKQLFYSLGFNAGELAFEPLRLRAIRHNGHLNPKAKAIYYPHRDTWYAHGQSMVVGWLPLHNQTAHQTFEIFPEWLEKAVANNSEAFNYDNWRQAAAKKIGWQNANTGLTAVYPQAQQPVNYGQAVGIAALRAECLFFSGAHFHKTLEQTSNITRFSVDFRFTYLNHYQRGLGAVNVDARCQGSAVKDYIHL